MGTTNLLAAEAEERAQEIRAARLEAIEECANAILAVPSSMSLYLTYEEAKAATDFKHKAVTAVLELAESKS